MDIGYYQHYTTKTKSSSNMNIHVKGLEPHLERSIPFNIDPTLTLGTFKARFCEEHGLGYHDWVFTFDGHAILDNHTVESIELECGDQIDVRPVDRILRGNQ
jgi:hypothetical protein